jgi:hypothetical protein
MPIQKFSSLCIFLNSGRTFTFRNVQIECDNESVLGFSYTAMSDGKLKAGTFQKSQMAGYSLSGPFESLIEEDLPKQQGHDLDARYREFRDELEKKCPKE